MEIKKEHVDLNVNEFQNCFVAYLDILGMREFIKKDNRDILNIIIKIMRNNVAFIETKQKETVVGELEFRGFYCSDSFVFMMEKKKESLSRLFFIIRYLQDQFWREGILMRGAVTVGDIYFPSKNEKILIGEALVDAYLLESKEAIYPRVIIHSRLVEYIRKYKLDAYPFGQKGMELTRFLRKDFDGIYFLDLLSPHVLRCNDESLQKVGNNTFSIGVKGRQLGISAFPDFIKAIEDKVFENYGNYKENIHIRKKYDWFKCYIEKKKKKTEQKVL